MKVGQIVDISKTDMFLTLGGQAIFWKDRKKLVLKKKKNLKHGKGVITSKCIISWITDYFIKCIFQKSFDKQVKTDSLLIF